ncbi:MAG: translation initiation factor [Bacteroidota bacterium]|jgi:predicted translation initiation factor SUI1
MAHLKKYRSLSELEQLLEPRPVILDFQKQKHDGKGNTVNLALDTLGRKGKIVTIVSGLQHNPATMEDIARMLKQSCGTGGTVKEGKIELQGDQRVRAAKELKEMNYLVK